MTERGSGGGGLGCLGVLGILFIGLKLAGVGDVAEWSWGLVLAPFWVPWTVAALALGALFVLEKRK